MWMREGERNMKQKKRENLYLWNIYYVWSIMCIIHIPPFNPHISLLGRHNNPWYTMRTWRLNNISKIEQWWSWSLKIGLSDFKSLVFPDVPLDPKTGLFLLGFCKLPFPLLPKHQFSLISSESPVTFHPLLHLLSPPTVNSFVPPAPIWGPISPFRLSTLCSTCSLVSLDPKLTWIFNYATKGYLRLASPLV